MAETKSSLKSLIGRKVVLDTAGMITYLGTLREIRVDGFWLEDADLHDSRAGHHTKEHYVVEARTLGIRANRARIFVLHEAVISISAFDDVIAD